MTSKEISRGVKEYLSEVPKAERLIRRLTSAVGSLRSSLTGQCSSLTEQVQHSGNKNPMEEAFARISQLETEIQDEICRLEMWRQEAVTKINRIDDLDQRNVLIARYVENKRWEQVADEMNFSLRQIHRIHGTALLAFAKKNPGT